jgi:hypothetical protein
MNLRWQLAGDLLPMHEGTAARDPDFVRNNMINFQGGCIAGYLNPYIVDRVNTVGILSRPHGPVHAVPTISLIAHAEGVFTSSTPI